MPQHPDSSRVAAGQLGQIRVSLGARAPRARHGPPRRPCQGANAEDVTLSFGDADGVPSVEEIKGMRRFHDVRKRARRSFCASRTVFLQNSNWKTNSRRRLLKVKFRHLNFVLVIHIAIRHLTGGGVAQTRS